MLMREICRQTEQCDQRQCGIPSWPIRGLHCVVRKCGLGNRIVNLEDT